MSCNNPKRLIQRASNKVQRYTDSGVKKIKAFDMWPCDECEESGGTPWLWEDCATPFYIYIIFTNLVTCDGEPEAPNGIKFKLCQINAAYSCEFRNYVDPCDDGTDWNVVWSGWNASIGGPGSLTLMHRTTGKLYFYEEASTKCQISFVNNMCDCADPAFYAAEGGSGEMTWDEVEPPN